MVLRLQKSDLRHHPRLHRPRSWLQDGRWLSIAGYCSPVWVGLTALILAAGQRAHCAICTGLLFNTMRNVKHPDASRFLGSYRLWTALQVIFHRLLSLPPLWHHCGLPSRA